MKKKFYWLVNVSMIALCLCALAIGVYSAKKASLTATGTIGFNALYVDATVDATITGAGTITPESGTALDGTTARTLATVTFNQTANGTLTTTGKDLATWNNNIQFDAEGTSFTYAITVTNKSQTRDMWVYIHDEIGFTYNVKKEITDGAHARKIAKGGTNSETFTIQFSLYSIYANAGDGETTPTYNFTINMYDEGAIPSADAEDEKLAYSKIEGKTAEAKVTGTKEGQTIYNDELGEVISVKPLIKIGDEVCIVTKMDNTDGYNAEVVLWNTEIPYTITSDFCDEAFYYSYIPYTITDGNNLKFNDFYVDSRFNQSSLPKEGFTIVEKINFNVDTARTYSTITIASYLLNDVNPALGLPTSSSNKFYTYEITDNIGIVPLFV